jgi:hypothetical protein
MEQHIMQVTVSGDRDKGVVGIGFIQFQYFFHPRRLSQLKMKTSKNTQWTPAAINKRVYCTKCKSPFTGKKGLDRYLKHTKATLRAAVLVTFPDVQQNRIKNVRHSILT